MMLGAWRCLGLGVFIGVLSACGVDSSESLSGSHRSTQNLELLSQLEGFWELTAVNGSPTDPFDSAYVFVASDSRSLAEVGCSGAAAVALKDSKLSLIATRYVEAEADSKLSTCFVHFLSDSNQVKVTQMLRGSAPFEILSDGQLEVVGPDGTRYFFISDD